MKAPTSNRTHANEDRRVLPQVPTAPRDVTKTEHPAFTYPIRMAVLGFRNLNQHPHSEWLGTGLVELFTSELGKSNELLLTSTENVSLTKADLDLTDTESLAASTLNRIRDRLDVDLVVLGSYVYGPPESDQIELTLSVQRTADGQSMMKLNHAGCSGGLVAACFAFQRRVCVRSCSFRPPTYLESGNCFRPFQIHRQPKTTFRGLRRFVHSIPKTARKFFEFAAENDSQSPLILDGLAQARFNWATRTLRESCLGKRLTSSKLCRNDDSGDESAA